MNSSLSDLLKQNPVFAGLDAGQLEQLAAAASARQYPTASYLTFAGDLWPYLFLVKTGQLNVVKESLEGRSLVIVSIGPGEVFWGPSFFGEDLPNPATLQFGQPSELLLWRREDIQSLLMENGKMSQELSRLMIRRMLRASEVIEGLAFQPVAKRLARLLIELPGQDQSGPIARSLTLDEMAARIGSSREVVCRFLQRFADEGLIRITRTEFEITDREQLANSFQKEK